LFFLRKGEEAKEILVAWFNLIGAGESRRNSIYYSPLSNPTAYRPYSNLSWTSTDALCHTGRPATWKIVI
jgi:hypothetical protein